MISMFVHRKSSDSSQSIIQLIVGSHDFGKHILESCELQNGSYRRSRFQTCTGSSRKKLNHTCLVLGSCRVRNSLISGNRYDKHVLVCLARSLLYSSADIRSFGNTYSYLTFLVSNENSCSERKFSSSRSDSSNSSYLKHKLIEFLFYLIFVSRSHER